MFGKSSIYVHCYGHPYPEREDEAYPGYNEYLRLVAKFIDDQLRQNRVAEIVYCGGQTDDNGITEAEAVEEDMRTRIYAGLVSHRCLLEISTVGIIRAALEDGNRKGSTATLVCDRARWLKTVYVAWRLSRKMENRPSYRVVSFVRKDTNVHSWLIVQLLQILHMMIFGIEKTQKQIEDTRKPTVLGG